jgi:hypothetical protein
LELSCEHDHAIVDICGVVELKRPSLRIFWIFDPTGIENLPQLASIITTLQGDRFLCTGIADVSMQRTRGGR